MVRYLHHELLGFVIWFKAADNIAINFVGEQRFQINIYYYWNVISQVKQK